jgi:hypothetical protein
MTSHRMELLATCGVAGRTDTLQVMLHQGHAFVSHPFSGGFSVIDVRDPRNPWSSVDLTAAERTALENVDIAWLYAHGANDFLLHNLFRFGVGGVTIEHYVRGIKAHLTSPGAGG